MFSYESQYLWIMLKLWLKMAWRKLAQNLEKNRTAVKTVSLLGQSLSAKVSWNHLPVLTTKLVHLRSVIVELVWFLNGENNIRNLEQSGVGIWTPNAYDHNRKHPDFPNITQKEYRKRIVENADFANKFGSLGGVYGYIWRDFGGVDQIERALQNLREKPESRQNLTIAWNPEEIPNVALPPCHFAFQLHTKDGRLSMTMYQRSADWFLGVPFNITSYALLLLLFAYHTNLKPDRLYIHFGDAHLYENQFQQAIKQILRWPFKKRPPQIRFVSRPTSDLKDLDPFMFEVSNYHHMGKIKAEMVV